MIPDCNLKVRPICSDRLPKRQGKETISREIEMPSPNRVLETITRIIMFIIHIYFSEHNFGLVKSYA